MYTVVEINQVTPVPKLLTRDQFREAVFVRDHHKCVFCGDPAVDAHHIMERRLFGDQGYYLDNGASVCGLCHIKCETTEYSVEDVRIACGVKRIVVPEHLYPDQPYDKWGNPILENGQRVRGELFDDPSVQMILLQGDKLQLFTNRVKFPRTSHLPWSPGMNSDDRMIKSMDAFIGQRVIATIKMDGENTTMYTDYIHARSIDGRNHPSRAWVKAFHGRICGDIPEGWRICGENLYAKHSIGYTNLPSYFMGFHVWNDANVCLAWDETIEYFDLIGITPVEVVYDGIYDEVALKSICSSLQWDTCEGLVLRRADSFTYGQYRTHVAKYVRKGHVQTNQHWMTGQRIEPNRLK